MKKNKVYVINETKESKKSDLVEFALGIIAYSIILLIASNIFKGFTLENYFYALIASLIISFLNSTIKPILIYFSLPITIMTMGLFYPVVNVIILKITSLILAPHFMVEGIIVPIFIAIFISFLRIVFDALFIKPLMEK